MFIQWFILSPRNAINAVVECIHNIITYCMIFGTLMNITLHKTQGQKKSISTRQRHAERLYKGEVTAERKNDHSRSGKTLNSSLVCICFLHFTFY